MNLPNELWAMFIAERGEKKVAPGVLMREWREWLALAKAHRPRRKTISICVAMAYR